MLDFGPFLPLLSVAGVLFGIIGTVGFVLAFIGKRNEGLSTVQASTIQSLQATIQSLQAQNEAQDKQMQTLEKKMARCEGVISTIRYTLKDRRRLRLEVKDDFVTLTDERTGAEITVPIHTSGQLEKEDKET